MRAGRRVFMALLSCAMIVVLLHGAGVLARTGVVEAVVTESRRQPLLRDTVIVFLVLFSLYRQIRRWAVRLVSGLSMRRDAVRAGWPEPSEELLFDARSREELAFAARHEAAHAVVAHLLGAHVREVSIRPGERNGCHTGGITSYGLDPSRLDFTESLYRMSMIAMAGRAIADLDGHTGPGCEFDADDAAAHAARVVATGKAPMGVDGPLTISNVFDFAIRHATELLVQHVGLVDVVAVELLSRRTLQHADLATLVEQA